MSDFTTWRSLVDGEEIGVIPDSVVSRPGDNEITDDSEEQGLEIELKSDWPSIGAEISSNTSGVTRAYLRQTDETLIEDVDISSLSAGDAFIFEDVDLKSGDKYIITVDAEGSSFTNGFTDPFEYPYTSDDVDITARYRGQNDPPIIDGQPAAINNIGNVGFD